MNGRFWVLKRKMAEKAEEAEKAEDLAIHISLILTH